MPACDQMHVWHWNVCLVSRRGDLPFTMRRIVSRSGIESDEDPEAKTETPEPKPEW